VNAVTGPYVQLASGAYLDLLDHDPAVLSIDDIFERFGVHISEPVKWVDHDALATVRRELLPDTGEPWVVLDGIEPWPEVTDP